MRVLVTGGAGQLAHAIRLIWTEHELAIPKVAAKLQWHGLVHTNHQGETTWHGFAKAIFEPKGSAGDLRSCSIADYPTPATRPEYSVLDGTRRAILGSGLMPQGHISLQAEIRNPDL